MRKTVTETISALRVEIVHRKSRIFQTLHVLFWRSRPLIEQSFARCLCALENSKLVLAVKFAFKIDEGMRLGQNLYVLQVVLSVRTCSAKMILSGVTYKTNQVEIEFVATERSFELHIGSTRYRLAVNLYGL